MRVLLVGGGGFIGRHVQQALRTSRHEPVPAAVVWAQAARPEAWQRPLAGIDAAIYLAGTVVDSSQGRWLTRLHHEAPLALARAMVQGGVPRLVHVSALCAGDSAYARSKRAGEAALLALRQPTLHLIRPSLVLGAGGASSRRLELLSRAPLWPLPRAMQRCRLQPLLVEDLAEALVRLLDAEPSGQARIAAGAEIDTLPGWLARRRAALAPRAATTLTLPDGLARFTARLGSRIGSRDWNEPIRALLEHSSVAPEGADTAWLPTLLGRPLRPVLEGAW